MRNRPIHNLHSTILPILLAAMVVCQLTIVIVSWIANALWPEFGMTSLLSHKGIRWMVGEMPDMLASEVMLWLLTAGMAWGVLHEVFRRRNGDDLLGGYAERIAFHVTIAVTIILTCLILFLIFGPDTILLSATGTYRDSSLSKGAVPMAFLMTAVIMSTYGLFSGRIASLQALYYAMCSGIRDVVPLLLIYLFVSSCYFSLMYVLP